jgi:hypothetical protein
MDNVLSPNERQILALDSIRSSANRYYAETGKNCEVIYISEAIFKMFGAGLVEVFGTAALVDRDLKGIACYARVEATK